MSGTGTCFAFLLTSLAPPGSRTILQRIFREASTSAQDWNWPAGFIMASTTPFTERTDCHGNKLHFGDMGGGLLVPAFPTIPDFRQHARDVREMELTPRDVIVAGFPKSGAHWVTSVVHMLMTGSTDRYFKTGLGSFLDRTPIRPHYIATTDSPRLFYTHLKLQYLPKQVREKKVKVIYLQRNPKDTWVSFFNHVTGHTGRLAYKDSWGHFFDVMMTGGYWYGDWFDYELDWERDIETERAEGLPVFVNAYEDLKKDPVSQIEKLDRFLGHNQGRELCERIAEACHFPTMKAAKQGEWKGDNFFQANAMAYYRKGEVGDWKNWFTVAQSEKFDQKFSDRMQGSKLVYTFE
ncbi:sulfotransferase 1A1-like [Babylonia areolata]|uniref:sulfotransferase 1A1-like n=1 Tax=Babylonia areolata TaxID=304850 RepID=UPI003FD65732